MAGDWIPITTDLPRRREVLLIADHTGMAVREVVGGLIEFWGWASGETSDGLLCHINVATLVRLFAIPDAYWCALIGVGWLCETANGLLIPNWDRWFSNSAKARMGNTLRQRMRRQKQRENVATNGATKARPEKRRGEKSIKKKEPIGSFSPEPPLAGSGEAVLVLPCVGKTNDGQPLLYRLTPAKLAEYQASFPGIDVLAELRKARQWLLDNPTRGKTVRGMTRFLGSWLGRAQDRGHVQPTATGAPTPLFDPSKLPSRQQEDSDETP